MTVRQLIRLNLPFESVQTVFISHMHPDHSAGLITYAQSCKINGVEVPHLVIQGERGPVTILLMPGQAVDEPQSITGESVNGVIIPVGDGSIAIIGDREEPLEPIQKNVVNSVAWTT